MVFIGLVAACAPMHVPQPPQVPQLDHQGDLRIGAVVAAQGLQLDAAYAPLDGLGVRGALHGEALMSQHIMLTSGVGGFAHPGNVRLALWADGGVGYAAAESTVDIDIFTDSPPTTTRLRAGLGQLSLTGDFGVDVENFEIATRVRANVLFASHTATSDGDGVGRLDTLEPVLLVRGGPPELMIEVYGGLMIPLGFVGEVGVPFPILLGSALRWSPSMPDAE